MSLLHAQFISDSLNRFSENLPRIENCLNRITEEDCWSKPNESTNSIANLMLHLGGNIRQYMISGLGPEQDLRERDQEFETNAGYTKEQLIKQLRITVHTAENIIRGLSEKQLIQSYTIQGFQLSGCDAVLHVIEHYSYHTGQIALLTKWLKNQDLGFYADFDLNKK